jgi:plastocyanin
MKKLLLSIALFSIGAAGFTATVTITNSGTSFNSAAVTITLGDNISFSLGSNHNAVEVSQATYDAKGNTPLEGGFSVAFGGGTVASNLLTAGIHYYVCTPHAALGMRGTITVLEPTGISLNTSAEGVSIYPNPTNGNFKLRINSSQPTKEYQLEIFNVLGSKVYSKSDIQSQGINSVDVADLPKGTYLVKIYSGREMYNRKIIVR